MQLKQLIKSGLGFITAKKHHINKIGKNVYIGKQTKITNGKNIYLGNDVQIRPYCDLFADDFIIINEACDIGIRNRIGGNVIFEKSVLTGPDNYFSLFDHCYTDPDKPIIMQGAYKPNNNGHDEMIIGEGSWIGTHCAIIGDVHIGKHCVVAANSVVTKDVPDYCVVAGAPAKIIKKYDFETKEWIRNK